jgi:hypothetical protein
VLRGPVTPAKAGGVEPDPHRRARPSLLSRVTEILTSWFAEFISTEGNLLLRCRAYFPVASVAGVKPPKGRLLHIEGVHQDKLAHPADCDRHEKAGPITKTHDKQAVTKNLRIGVNIGKTSG